MVYWMWLQRNVKLLGGINITFIWVVKNKLILWKKEEFKTNIPGFEPKKWLTENLVSEDPMPVYHKSF